MAKDMTAERQFTAVYQKRGRWYVAFVEELPGVNTQGRTLREARENLKEALELVIEANRGLALKDAGELPVRRETISVETSSGWCRMRAISRGVSVRRLV